ncbi:MAG: tetratricopeptide repeat protein [Promethearchaeota archaeon]
MLTIAYEVWSVYKHYESSDHVFVDREEYIEWMNEALERCNQKADVLHLKGIGGIGKSSLIDHWMNTHEETVPLDCEQYTEFYHRLNMLAKGVVLTGVNLPRFDVLWQIRQRFVEGVEPVKEEGREWAKDVVMAIPFIGSLASIGTAISSVGKKVAPTIKNKYGSLGAWLQDRLGKDHIERLLEILWKEPRRAEFLFVDALLEDINNRKTIDRPIIFLMDHYEYVDNEHARWRYSGRQITESELWKTFLLSLKCCVGVTASRRAATATKALDIEESELTELDRDSCLELLELRNIGNPEIQERIISITGGNPFVIGTICDMNDSGKLSLEALEGLRADTLEEVRLKTWRRLFRETNELLPLVDRVGLLPYFNRRILNVIVPDLKTDQWDRLVKLSFVKERDDRTWVLHDLAEELVRAEMGDRLHVLGQEVMEKLDSAHASKPDYTLLGFSISVQALIDHDEALSRFFLEGDNLLYIHQVSEVHTLVDAVKIDTFQGRATVKGLRGFVSQMTHRVADSEHIYKEVLEMAEEMAKTDRILGEAYTSLVLHWLGRIYSTTERVEEAEAALAEAVRILREHDKKNLARDLIGVPFGVIYPLTILFYGVHKIRRGHLREGKKLLDEANSMMTEFFKKHEDEEKIRNRYGYVIPFMRIRLAVTNFLMGDVNKAEDMFRETIASADKLGNKMTATEWLCEVLRLSGRLEEAEPLYQESLKHWREVVGEDSTYRFSLLLCLNSCSSTSALAGRLAEAEQGYSESLETARELYEHDSTNLPLLAWTLRDFAVVLNQLGKLNEADKIHEEALNVTRQIIEETDQGHERLAIALSNSSVFLYETGKTEKSRKQLERALELGRKTCKEKPDAVFVNEIIPIVLSNLSVSENKVNKLSESLQHIEEAYNLQRKLAEVAPNLFTKNYTTILNNLGIVRFKDGNLKTAEELLQEALDRQIKLAKQSKDQYSLGLSVAYHNLSLLYSKTDREKDSKSAKKKALEVLDDLDSKGSLFEYRGKRMREYIEGDDWILQTIEVIDPPFW